MPSAEFVGCEAVEEASRIVLYDQFQGDDGGKLQDIALIDRFVSEKLEQETTVTHAGVKEGSGAAQRTSSAAYAALVSAEINRQKHCPASARENGTGGAVGVVFSIGSSGAIISHSITRSSGNNSAIDATVHQMLAASHPPHPPGGSFRGSVTISFNLAKWPARAKSQGRDAWSIRGPGKGMGFSCKSTRLDLSVENRMSAVST